MNWMRGAIRLWLVSTVIWIGAVGFVERPDQRPNPPRDLFEEAGIPPPPLGFILDPNEALLTAQRIEWKNKIEHAAVLAFVPPLLVLVLGICGVWVWRGFMKQ
jgi:hypothetical protein